MTAATRRICFYTDTTAVGGAEESLLALIEGLDRSLWQPTLAYHASPGVERLVQRARGLDVELWPTTPIPEGGIGAARAVRFAAELRRRRPDVFHAHLTYELACKYGLAAALLARVPAVLGTYQLLVQAPATAPTVLQQRILARRIGTAIVVSRGIGTYLEARFGWRREKIRLIHNGVPARPLPDADELKRTLSPDGKPIALTVARLDPFKGHRYLLRAAVDLPDVRFVLAGDGPERGALEREARELGVESRVAFLGTRTDIPALLATAELMLLPSLAEGTPLALLEAMAAGVPVVATPVGDVPDAVEHGRTGLLVPPADPAALTAAVRRLISDRELRSRLGEAGAARVRVKFDVGQMVDQVTASYAALLERAAA